jgi:hypothetical protein
MRYPGTGCNRTGSVRNMNYICCRPEPFNHVDAKCLVASAAPSPTTAARLNCSPHLATATPERVVAGGRPMEVVRVRITNAGRRWIAEL